MHQLRATHYYVSTCVSSEAIPVSVYCRLGVCKIQLYWRHDKGSSSDSPSSSPSASNSSPTLLLTLLTCCPGFTRALYAGHLLLRCSHTHFLTFCSDIGSSDLDHVSRVFRMSRQNSRRLTEPAGDNPAKRTLSLNLKITFQVSAFRVATSTLGPSEHMVLWSSCFAGPSHPQIGAGAPSATAV